jgi:hypothetical protein
MTKETDFRQNAADTMKLAQSASSTADKGRLLKLAEAWLDLADRSRRIARRMRKRDLLHPLIKDTFKPHPDE